MRGPAAGVLVFGVALPAAAAPTEAGDLQYPLEPWHTCNECHQFDNPFELATEPSIAPMGWQGSMMANAARDPVFWAGVAVASQDAPGETELCVRCHAPRAFLEGYGDAIAIDELPFDDQGGVECELCHRMIDDGALGNAQYAVDDVAVDGAVPRRGPWTYADKAGPPHAWLEDATFLDDARLCGTCHDVTTPRERVDDDGAPLGVGFNEQRTYSEWAGSAFATPGAGFASCQDCHMPVVEDVPGCEWTLLSGFNQAQGRRHDLVGVGRHMMGILKQVYGGGGLAEVPSFHYDASADLVDALIATAATVDIDAPAMVDVTEGLDGVTITVTNETGHKLPTGYAEGRVMWLEVTASVGETLVWSSGRWDPEAGIEADPQVRRYEAIAERYADGEQLHLLQSDHWIVDNRIPPAGLVPDIETDPVGDRYTLAGDGHWPGYDVATYAFDPADVEDPTPDEPDILLLRVRLLYLVNTPEYVEFLADANATNDAGDTVAALFETYGAPEPLVLADESVELTAVGLTPPAGNDDTGSTGPGSTGSGPTTGPDPTSATTAPPTSTGSAGTGGTDDGPDADAPPADGCGCRNTGQPVPLWLLLFLACRPMGQRRSQSRKH